MVDAGLLAYQTPPAAAMRVEEGDGQQMYRMIAERLI